MGLYIIDLIEPTNFKCSDCVWFMNDCKRIDPPKLTFYRPWFSSDKDDPNHMICSDFQPNPGYIEMYIDYHRYKNFDELFNSWKTFWAKDCELKQTWFFINGNKKVDYGVDYKDFVYGTMYDEKGRLKTRYKRYYKQTRKSPYGYSLITEKCSFIDLSSTEKEVKAN